jgi:hypothetical protein
VTLDPNTLAALQKLFPQAAIDVGTVYGPAIARMALTEFAALVEMLNNRKQADAQAAVRAKMTPEELAAEKETLTPLFAQMASDQADALDLGKTLLVAGLKAAAVLAMGAGLF